MKLIVLKNLGYLYHLYCYAGLWSQLVCLGINTDTSAESAGILCGFTSCHSHAHT